MSRRGQIHTGLDGGDYNVETQYLVVWSPNRNGVPLKKKKVPDTLVEKMAAAFLYGRWLCLWNPAPKMRLFSCALKAWRVMVMST